jgi:hypothetical protein
VSTNHLHILRRPFYWHVEHELDESTAKEEEELFAQTKISSPGGNTRI